VDLGGMTAGIDLALAMIEKDLGGERRPSRRQEARGLSPPCRGPIAVFGAARTRPKSDRIQSALTYAKRNLATPLTVGRLAGAVHLSPRQFQPCVPRRDRPIAGQGDRESAPRAAG